MNLKKLCLLILLAISFLSYAQKQQKEYYDNGQLKEIGNVDENDNPIGEWKEYYENGQLKAQIIIEKQEGTGSSITYYRNGNTEEEINYKNYEKTGSYIKYNNNGDLVESGNYTNDEKTGIWEENTYHDNGNIKEEKLILYDKEYPTSYYKEEIRHGIYKGYYENGQLKEKIDYKYGDPNGEFSSYYKNGNKRDSGTITKNGYEGDINEYYEDGNIKKTTTYLNGKKIEEIEYDDIEDDVTETIFKIHFKSNCNETISILIRTRKNNGEWVSEGWWTLKPGKDIYVADSRNTIIYYYAESNTGKWKGSNHKSFEGKEYPFKKWDLSNKERGIVTKGLSCSGN